MMLVPLERYFCAACCNDGILGLLFVNCRGPAMGMEASGVGST